MSFLFQTVVSHFLIIQMSFLDQPIYFSGCKHWPTCQAVSQDCLAQPKLNRCCWFQCGRVDRLCQLAFAIMPAARAWKVSNQPRTLSTVVSGKNSSGLKALWSPSVSPKALDPHGRVLGEQTGDLVAGTGRVPQGLCVIVGLLCWCTGHFSH